MNTRIAALSRLLIFFILSAILAACNPVPPLAPSTLQLEEHTLAAAPDPETGAFLPVEGTQAEILARHASERARVYQQMPTTIQGNPALLPNGEASNLAAMMVTTPGDPLKQAVEVLLAGTPIFTADAGLPSPVLPLQGLWTYDGHWALEILFADESTWAGQVFIDGELVNQEKGYDEAFGFQLLAGKPFYFYSREGHVGYAFDGQETDLDYDQIPHYFCCGEAALNPVQSQDMVAFFAQRGDDWFYVELGAFEAGYGSL
jgi:hypothetical protein